MKFFRIVSVLIAYFFLHMAPSRVLANTSANDSELFSEDEERYQMLTTTAAAAGAVTLWGIWKWDYFSRSPHSRSEGWFGYDTDDGGADKLGHMYSTYIFSHGLSAYYKYRGFSEEDAALYGAFSSFAILGCMELGDSFSDYGFSYEDMLANGLGALLGYVLESNADLASKIDFRWEYGIKPSKTDFTTDYENAKFLLAVKLNGFAATQDTLWRHVEFHLGYYSRGFDEHDDNRQRSVYVGIGLNLTDLLQRNHWQKTAALLRYVQLPYTSVTSSKDFDD